MLKGHLGRGVEHPSPNLGNNNQLTYPLIYCYYILLIHYLCPVLPAKFNLLNSIALWLLLPPAEVLLGWGVWHDEGTRFIAYMPFFSSLKLENEWAWGKLTMGSQVFGQWGAPAIMLKFWWGDQSAERSRLYLISVVSHMNRQS